MRRKRSVLVIVLSLVVSAQPWASPVCTCGGHGDPAETATTAGQHHGGQHDANDVAGHEMAMDDAADSRGCAGDTMVCHCGACTHLVALISNDFVSLTTSVDQDQASPPHYLEPPQSRAFRPPIQI